MDTLPLETLQRIFELACTDGGRTGHSLSLVSKGIRAAARTTRFHSIVLIASPRRLQLFLDLYQRECDPTRGGKPRIQHLHVAFPVVDIGRVARTYPDGVDQFWPLAHTRSLEPAPSPLAMGNVRLVMTMAPLPAVEGAVQDVARTSTMGALQPTPKRNGVRPVIWTKTLLVALRRYCTARTA